MTVPSFLVEAIDRRQYSLDKGVHADRRVLMRLSSALSNLNTLTYEEVAQLALDVPEALRILACDEGDQVRNGLGLTLPMLVLQLFNIKLPGKDDNAKALRAMDPHFWRKALWLKVLQHQEYRRLAAGEIGAKSPYASSVLVGYRQAQLERQKQWLKTRQLYTNINGEEVIIPLEKVIKTVEQRMARVYAFVQAIDRLAEENQLEMALITTTLPGDWHNNPEYKRKTWKWNGKSPKDGADELTRLFQNVRRDLDNAGVYLSGLWVGELHKDGTPHRHYWCAYKPEHAKLIRAVFLKYFPGKLKLRGSSPAGDLAFLNAQDALDNKFVELRKNRKLARKGFQVDMSVIDRDRGSGASYCFKYLEKAMLQEAAFESNNALRAIDSSRSLWRMRSFDFFGVQKCLGRWDELRRLNTKPADPFLFQQWVAARGGEKEGKIGTVVDPETGAEKPEQQGDAYTFLTLNGSLAALREGRVSKPAPNEVRDEVALAKEARTNRYQEPTAVVKGVQHVQKKWVRNRMSVDPDTGEIATYKRGAKKGEIRYSWGWEKTVVSSEVTRPYTWTIEAEGHDAVRAALKAEYEAYLEAKAFRDSFVGPLFVAVSPEPVKLGQLDLF